MKKKILLCINNKLGLKVLKILINKNVDLQIYSTFSLKRKHQLIKNKKTFNKILLSEKNKYDFIILVYWPWLVEKKCFKNFKYSINFHPSLLPYGRGWYPHIHAQIFNTPYGVTLHSIDGGIDTGKIWCQRKVQLKKFLTSDKSYELAQNKILLLFKTCINKILDNKIKPKNQNKKLPYLKKSWTDSVDELKLTQKNTLKYFINLIRARMHHKRSYSFILENKIKYKLKIDLI